MSTYQLDWTGRADAEAAAHTPPCAQVGYVGVLGDTSAEVATTPAGTAASGGPTPTLPSTGSMVVEGDNLDALKHLRQTHKTAYQWCTLTRRTTRGMRCRTAILSGWLGMRGGCR